MSKKYKDFRMKEVKSYIETDPEYPYGTDRFMYKECGDDGFKITAPCWTVKVDLTWEEIEIKSTPGHCMSVIDCGFFIWLNDNLKRIKNVWNDWSNGGSIPEPEYEITNIIKL